MYSDSYLDQSMFGTRGTRGTVGTRVTSGASGISGTSGASGISGTSGTRGARRTSRTSGTSRIKVTEVTEVIVGANVRSGTNVTGEVNGEVVTGGTCFSSKLMMELRFPLVCW